MATQAEKKREEEEGGSRSSRSFSLDHEVQRRLAQKAKKLRTSVSRLAETYLRAGLGMGEGQ